MNMQMQNIHEPTPEEVHAWALDANPGWPASDWDFYVLRNPHNDELVVRLASDVACAKREFFLHALYGAVGEAFYNRPLVSQARFDRIRRLMAFVSDNAQSDVLEWKRKAEQVLAGQLDIDPKLWLHFMFQEAGDERGSLPADS